MEKEIFEKLVTEYQSLHESSEKHKAFILDKEKFDALDPINKDLIIAQLKAMETYESILAIRIGVNQSILQQNKKEGEPDQSTVEGD